MYTYSYSLGFLPLWLSGKEFFFFNCSGFCHTVVKNLPANAGDTALIPGSGRSPRLGNGNPLQYSCLENPMDRGAGGLQPVEWHRVRHD